MADTAQYAGDDYIVRLNGLDPYARHLDFLPWRRVESHWVIPDGPGHDFHEALKHHPEGTTLHADAPLAKRVEDHFKQYGVSIDDVASRYEHVVRGADPWLVNYGKGWYQHEAGHAVDRLVTGGYNRHTAAHIIADLSPQNQWLGTANHPELGNREEAVRYGTEVTKMKKGTGRYKDHVLEVSDADAQWAHDHFVSEKTGRSTATLQPGRYDISGHPSHWDIQPEQIAELPIYHSRAGRRERTHAIKTALGVRHADEFGAKTAAFGHNIEHPLTSMRVTIDTHMADSAGAKLTKDTKNHFISSKGGVKNEGAALGAYGGRTGGYGMAGIASATLEATRRLNESPEKGWGRSQPDLLPHQVQAIVWNHTLMGKSRPFRDHIETLRTLPFEHVYGYNFEAPQAA